MKTISLLRRLVCAALLFTLYAPFAAHAQSNGYIRAYQFGHSDLYYPEELAIDGQGNVYVVDFDYGHVYKYSNAGAYIMQFGDSPMCHNRMRQNPVPKIV